MNKIIKSGILVKHLHKLRNVERKKHHHLLHHIHKKHKISRETLFYVKEYGPHSNVARVIIKESLKILIFTSILSAVGGVTLENIKVLFVSIMPLIIMLPVLNDMIGDYGTIISGRFSTMMHEGKIKKTWISNKDLKKLFIQIAIVAIVMAVLSSALALLISSYAGYDSSMINSIKIAFIALIDVTVLVTLLFFVAIISGIYIYNKKEDPNNFLVPITTSIADFGNMIILAVLVILMF